MTRIAGLEHAAKCAGRNGGTAKCMRMWEYIAGRFPDTRSALIPIQFADLSDRYVSPQSYGES